MSARLFVAVDPADAVRARIIAQARALRSALRRDGLDDAFRWVADGNLHVTLRFLGDVDEAAVPSVVQAFETVEATARSITLGEPGTFPPRGRPRILHVRVTSGVEFLAALRDRVDRALSPVCRWASETRPFSPHLTLARSRDRAALDSALFHRILDAADWSSVETAVTEVRLFRSVTRASGPEYSVLARAALGSN